MKTKISHLIRMALIAISFLCLSASVMAGPGPMFIMIDGKMMMVTPLTKDMTLKNGCKVCTNGIVTSPTGKTIKLSAGEMLSSKGVKMQPLSKLAHGG
jgi:hypothetical protein